MKIKRSKLMYIVDTMFVYFTTSIFRHWLHRSTTGLTSSRTEWTHDCLGFKLSTV